MVAPRAKRINSVSVHHPIMFPILAEPMAVIRCRQGDPVFSARLNRAKDPPVGEIAKPMPASLAIGIFEHEGLLAPLAKGQFHRSNSLFSVQTCTADTRPDRSWNCWAS